MALVFKNAEDEYFVLFADFDTAEEGVQRLRNRFRLGWGENDASMVHPYWLYLPHANVVDSVENLLYFYPLCAAECHDLFRDGLSSYRKRPRRADGQRA